MQYDGQFSRKERPFDELVSILFILEINGLNKFSLSACALAKAIQFTFLISQIFW